jgi:hypothetical protein
VANDEERRFRLRSRKPAARTERIALASAHKTIMDYARITSRHLRSREPGSGRARPHFQRCAVGTKNSTRGQSRANGHYVSREGGTHGGDPRAVGFNATEESIDIAARLEGWQKANDELRRLRRRIEQLATRTLSSLSGCERITLMLPATPSCTLQ